MAQPLRFIRELSWPARAPQKPPLLRQMSPSLFLLQRVLRRELTPAEIAVSTASAPLPPGHPVPPDCRYTIAWGSLFPLEYEDKPPQLQGLQYLRLKMVSCRSGSLLRLFGRLTSSREPHGRDRLDCRCSPCACFFACLDGTHSVRQQPRRACENPSCGFPPPPDHPFVIAAGLAALGVVEQ